MVLNLIMCYNTILLEHRNTFGTNLPVDILSFLILYTYICEASLQNGPYVAEIEQG